MKRIALFLATNLAIVLVLSVTVRLLGIEPYLTAQGLNLGSLLVFAAVMGFGGSFLSLALSKWTAKRAMGVQVIETPVNPTLDVVDLHRLATICRSKGTTLVVDNTAATPLALQPLSLGADLVVASATKALSGHSDLLAGYVAGCNEELMARVERDRLLAGPILGTFEAWLVLRSLGTAGLRIERQCRNAAAVALMLRDHPAVRSVRYPGLPGDPSYPVAAEQMKRFGGLVAVELADAAAVHALVERSSLLVAATSFGGLHTCVDRRARWGDPVGDGFARLSLGIEDTDDIGAEIEGALA